MPDDIYCLLTPGCASVAVELVKCHVRTGSCGLTKKELAEKANVGVGIAGDTIKRLREANAISVEQKGKNVLEIKITHKKWLKFISGGEMSREIENRKMGSERNAEMMARLTI